MNFFRNLFGRKKNDSQFVLNMKESATPNTGTSINVSGEQFAKLQEMSRERTVQENATLAIDFAIKLQGATEVSQYQDIESEARAYLYPLRGYGDLLFFQATDIVKKHPELSPSDLAEQLLGWIQQKGAEHFGK